MSSDHELSDFDTFSDDDMDEDMMMDQDDEDSAISEEELDAMEESIVFEAPTNKPKAYDVEFKALRQDQIQDRIRKDIEYIASVLGVSTDVSSLFLRSMAWNKERLIEKYYDDSNGLNVKAGIIAEAPSPAASSSSRSLSNSRSRSSGVAPRRSSRRAAADSGSKSRDSSQSAQDALAIPESPVCSICFDDSQTEFDCLSCDHKFCSDCWALYLTGKLREAESTIRCMASGCTIMVPDSFIIKILSDEPDLINRYRELMLRDYVAAHKHLKFCPHPNCNYTVSCQAASSKAALTSIVPTVHCGASVDHTFCFGCPIDSDHRPVICAVAKLWLQKCQDDSETANWIKTNTKDCPGEGCDATIEKNGGCNHMTCKKCKYEFCWVCLGVWSSHGNSWYTCNRYNEKQATDARDAQNRSRASLERYLHYYNRWANHELSARLSIELYQKTEKKMEEMQITSKLTWIEVQFAKKAVDELFKCRMTLKWTYAMAYYLADGNAKDLFEDNQSDLEHAVEQLTELVEQPVEAEAIPRLKEEVINKTVYVRNRNEIMLEDTAKGFLEGRWLWNTTVEGFE